MTPSPPVCVVGLGYVGLPLATALALSGVPVIGVDNDENKVHALRRTEAPTVVDAPEDLEAALRSGRLSLKTDYAGVSGAGTVLLCLPTPIDEHREPDLSMVAAATEEVAARLSPGALVVLESTTYPGTTRGLVLPILEGGKRKVGRDFNLAYAPERVDPGNKEYGLANTPRFVAGITPDCAQRAANLYRRVVREVSTVSSPETAEMAKILENVFRGVNIALVNELAVLCNRMGIDVWEVVEAAKTKPFGFMPFYPGPGLGGHCIPVDPFYLAYRARAYDSSAEFVELAGRINVGMPYHAVARITEALNVRKKPVRDSRILVLGASYKPDVGDIRESPSLKIMALLKTSGADIAYHDPYVPRLPNSLRSVDLTKDELARADCVVVATDHGIVDLKFVVTATSLVVDLRNAVRRRLDLPPHSPPPRASRCSDKGRRHVPPALIRDALLNTCPYRPRQANAYQTPQTCGTLEPAAAPACSLHRSNFGRYTYRTKPVTASTTRS